jgi:predicted ATPase
MYFSEIRIHNYKSYRDSATLRLNTGINVVVGRNNAGKTALLEALSLGFDAIPHRSFVTLPSESRLPKPLSTVEFTFILTREELLDLLINEQLRGNVDFRLALPAIPDPVWKSLKLKDYNGATAERFIEWFFSHETYTFSLQREAIDTTHANWHVTDESYISPHFERSGKYDETGLEHYGQFHIDIFDRTFSHYSHNQVSGGGRRHYDDFILRIGRHLHRSVYLFRAERFPFGVCELGVEQTLASDARNLAEVIHLLQQNLNLFTKYNEMVREVLSEVKQVGTRKVDAGKGEVVVWTDSEALHREGLAFSLAECGSGVGQVLSILYVLLMSESPQIILIDEPQSFLHPGAIRKMIEILRQSAESKHQIVIATHSPTVITGADPTTITLIRQDKGESVLEPINIKETKHQQGYLREVGARLADVFGFDRVLWVEGETEEICFPIILRELARKHLMGTAILRVQHSGDFNRKDARTVFSIYERLSHLEGGLVPPVVGFIFDREARKSTEREDLRRQSNNRIHFTPKRLYENYLLNPAAIAAVVNDIEGFSRRKVTPQRVRKWLDKNLKESKYYRPLKVPDNRNEWTDDVHGAHLLEDLFAELSQKRVTFDKTEHSVALTQWIVRHSPADLDEILRLIIDAVGGEEK